MNQPKPKTMPGVSVSYAGNGKSITSNAMGMRAMQQRVWQFRGEQYLLLKSPPASGKSRALMFVALDKLHRQNLKQAIVVVPEKSIGASFGNTLLAKDGFFSDWKVAPHWNLCNAPGTDGGKVDALGRFLASEDRLLVCTHATFRFAFEKFGVEAFDDRLIAVDEFHHVSVSEDNRLGEYVRQLIERDKTQLIAMTGSYFRGDAAAVLLPEDERKFITVTYTYYEQLSGYRSPRSAYEAGHQVIAQTCGDREKIIGLLNHHMRTPLWNEREGEFPSICTLEIAANRSRYRSGDFVGKSVDVVSRDGSGSRFKSGDAEVYGRWTQALQSAASLLGKLNREYNGAQKIEFTWIVPILVVPDQRLFVVDYDDSAVRSCDPYEIDRTPFFIDYKPPIFECDGPTFKFGHFEIMTYAGLKDFVENLTGDDSRHYLDLQIGEQACFEALSRF